MQTTRLLVLATMAISAHGVNLKGTTEQAVEIATTDGFNYGVNHKSWGSTSGWTTKPGPQCLVLPGSMNGGKHPRGCPGAVWSNGNPAWSYCLNRDGRFPWWKDCCQWKDGSCKPKNTVKKMCRWYANSWYGYTVTDPLDPNYEHSRGKELRYQKYPNEKECNDYPGIQNKSPEYFNCVRSWNEKKISCYTKKNDVDRCICMPN